MMNIARESLEMCARNLASSRNMDALSVAGAAEAPLSAWHKTPRALGLFVVLLARHVRVRQARAEPFLLPPPALGAHTYTYIYEHVPAVPLERRKLRSM